MADPATQLFVDKTCKHLGPGMHRAKRLTESVIIRSLCGGNLRFFEAALAKRADGSYNESNSRKSDD